MPPMKGVSQTRLDMHQQTFGKSSPCLAKTKVSRLEKSMLLKLQVYILALTVGISMIFHLQHTALLQRQRETSGKASPDSHILIS